MKSSDFSNATDCGMSVFFYVYYSRIFQRQIECHKKGIRPPKEKIIWLNHWFKFCRYQEELSREELLNEIYKAREENIKRCL